MAKMDGCNTGFKNMKKAQGVNTITPGKFARNNLAMGGTNNMEAKSGKTSYGSGLKTRVQR